MPSDAREGALPDMPWWKGAVVYQIYPRSFADGNGDGIGDLPGIRRRIDHLSWLGVDALWLSPIYRSPMADFGYDVADHCDIDPVFGTLADADGLIADAHERGIRVLLDWVPNHTSDQHPWFQASRSSRDDPKRGWYVWRDGRSDPAGTPGTAADPPPRRPPNNWRAAFTGATVWQRDDDGQLRAVAADPGAVTDKAGTAWTYDETTDQWYLHLFLPEQPDLDWSNADVESAMHDVLRFWLDRGVDGFRADVIHAIGKDPALPDDPPDLARIPKSATNDHAATHELLRRIRALLDGYGDGRMMVGEVYLLDTSRVATYYGDGDELHLAFNFPPLYARWSAPSWQRQIQLVDDHLRPRHAWPTWVLSNHDNPRHRSRYGREPRARAAAVLLLGLRGTPFLFAGEELGLEDADIPVERRVDPGGRDGCRAPLPWERRRPHGWTDDPWLPFPPDAGDRSVESQCDDPASMLHLYRRLLAARRTPALRHGEMEMVVADDAVLVWDRHLGDDRRRVAVSFTAEPQPLDGQGWVVEVASDGAGEGRSAPDRLGPDQAVVLRPA